MALLFTATGCQPAPPDEASIAKALAADEAVIRQLDAEWMKVGAAKNIDGWVAYYAAAAVVLPPNEPIATDHAAIRRSVAGLLTIPNLSLTWQPSRVEVSKSGDLAYLYGSYSLAATDEHGKPISDKGKILEIWKKQADGKWKCIVDTWNSDLPVPAPPSSK
jgi:ketosteroid isomerase-like protein